MSSIQVTSLDEISSVSHVLALGPSGLGRVSYDALSAGLAASGALASTLVDLRQQIVSGLLAPATWSELVLIVGATDAAGAEVPVSDGGEHLAATATGYDGATVKNAGRYSWSEDWQRWRRIGEYSGVVSDVILTAQGTGDVIAATSDRTYSTTPYASKFVMDIVNENTGPVTLAIDGGAAFDLVTNTGATLAPGELIPGSLAEFRWTGAEYQLTAGQSLDASIALAERAAEQATEAALALQQFDYIVADEAALASVSGASAGNTAYVQTTKHKWSFDGSVWSDQGPSLTIQKLDQADWDARFQTLAPESGYIFGVRDLAGNFLSGYDTTGAFEWSVLSPRAIVPRANFQGSSTIATEAGFVWALGDEARNLLFGVESDGAFWANPSEDMVARGAARAAFASGVRSALKSNTAAETFVLYGDSMTIQTGEAAHGFDATNMGDALGSALGVEIINRANGGSQSSAAAIMQGARPFPITLDGGLLLGDGSEITVTDYGGAIPFNNQVSQQRSALLDGVSVWFRGYWNGTSLTNFTVAKKKIDNLDVVIDDGTPLVFQSSLDEAGLPSIIWTGRNNSSLDPFEVTDLRRLRDDVLAMAGHNTAMGRDFLVVSVLNSGGENEWAGTDRYQTILEINAELSKYLGDRYIDLRSYMVNDAIYEAGITPTATDLDYIANDAPPPSFHHGPPHFNGAGNTMVARFIARNVQSRFRIPRAYTVDPAVWPDLYTSR